MHRRLSGLSAPEEAVYAYFFARRLQPLCSLPDRAAGVFADTLCGGNTPPTWNRCISRRLCCCRDRTFWEPCCGNGGLRNESEKDEIPVFSVAKRCCASHFKRNRFRQQRCIEN